MSIIPVGGNTGMPSWYSPRVFITYARENSELAKIIRDRLTAGRFFVFLDVREILTGEYFARVIERALRRCDSVVAIVSVHSVRSNWCVAELVQAHTLGKPIAPVLAEPVEITFPEPLKFLLEPLHYISATQPASYSVAVNELEQHLLVAKRRRTGRILKHISFGLLGTILIVLGSVWAIRSINAVGRERDREDVLARVSSAASTLNRGTIDNLASRLPGDRELSQRLMLMTQNQDLSDVQRINAVMLANKLLAPQLRQLRWYLKDLHWDDAALLRTSISNVTS